MLYYYRMEGFRYHIGIAPSTSVNQESRSMVKRVPRILRQPQSHHNQNEAVLVME